MKTANKKTLADKIAGVLSTAPESFDPEDDNVDDTRAKLIDEDLSQDNTEEVLLSSFRKQNIDLLGDVDERYAGKKSSRKSLRNSDESESEDESEQEYGNTYQSDKDGDEPDTDENSDSTKEDTENEESESEDSDEVSDIDDTINYESDTDKGNFKHFKENDLSSQVKKGLCVRNQMSMWENLLEIRIQLQKCLLVANKMPQQNKYAEIKKESGQEFSDQVSVTKNSLGSLLDKLLLLQKIVVSKYPETKQLSKNKSNDNEKNNSDEEIPSDTEDEKSDGDNEEAEVEDEVPKKKRRLNDFEDDISKSHDSYKNYRNSVIKKWNDKTKIAVLKNNAHFHSIVNHIEHTLSDRSKLIKRTQLKRSEYCILGQDPPPDNISSSGDLNNDNRTVEEYNSEIFDDDDFYHQLLRELIEVKSADVTDPIQLSRQWIQLQKLRSKMKRKIDTRATKGRKIRYTVHTKLVNFMAPMDECLWTDQAKTELFNSLFGKKEYTNVSYN